MVITLFSRTLKEVDSIPSTGRNLFSPDFEPGGGGLLCEGFGCLFWDGLGDLDGDLGVDVSCVASCVSMDRFG